MINTFIDHNLPVLVAEVASLNRQLLLLQIEKLEDEILPCENQLQQALSHRLNHTIGNSGNNLTTIFNSLATKVAMLRSLRTELNQTEKLVSVSQRILTSENSDC